MSRTLQRLPLDGYNPQPQQNPTIPLPSTLQRQYSQPRVLQRQRSGPGSQPQPQPQPQITLQRQRSRPEQQYQEQPPRTPRTPQTPVGLPSRPNQQALPLQRQPSRPDQPLQDRPPRALQRQPSRPDQYYSESTQGQPMPDSHRYAERPIQPVAPVFMHTSPQPPIPTSDSQATLFSPPSRPYADPMLIRGNSNDELDKTDVFWRRFNASAQQPDAEKSSWLERSQGKSSRWYRTMWIVGLIFVLLAAGGVGIGIFLSFRNNSETRPSAIGGAADITSGIGGATATAASATRTTHAATAGGIATSSFLHVAPTNTVP